MEFHVIFSPIIRILVHHHPSILKGLSNSPLFQYFKFQHVKKKLFTQSKVTYVGTRCDLLWHMHITRNLFLMQLLNSNYKSIFHKCSLACSFALENLSTHMQTHILHPGHFPFFSDFCNSITEFWERERERSQTQCQFGQSNSKRQIPRSQKNGAFNNVVLLFSQCNKRT